MKLSEFKRYLKSMDGSEKDELILELYRRQTRLDKELVELIMTGIHEHKELPASKAVIPDLKTAGKRIAEYESRMHGYPGWRRGRMRAKFKVEAKQILRDLCAVPPRAQEYEKSVELLHQLWKTLQSGRISGYPWKDPFADLHTSFKDVYRDLCALRLADGHRISAFEYLLDAALTIPAEMWADQIELAEVLNTFAGNNDLRSELVFLCEERICRELPQWEQTPVTERQNACMVTICRAALAWLVFASSADTFENACRALRPLLKTDARMRVVLDLWEHGQEVLEKRNSPAEFHDFT